MDDKTATFRVEMHYQGSAASTEPKGAVSEVTLAEGATLYLEDKQHDHPNLPHFNFRILEVAAVDVSLEQIPDRRGQIQPAYITGAAGPPGRSRLEKGKPISISLNVPGGGPAWTVTWISPGAQSVTQRSRDSLDYRNIQVFFATFIDTPSFSVEDAVKLLGEKLDTLPANRIVLKPKDPEVARIQLEVSGSFLQGISIEFAAGHYLSISFSGLIQAYGEPRQLALAPPILRPGEPYRPNYSYSFTGRRTLLGVLVVTVQGVRKGDMNRVVGVIYRRLQ